MENWPTMQVLGQCLCFTLKKMIKFRLIYGLINGVFANFWAVLLVHIGLSMLILVNLT